MKKALKNLIMICFIAFIGSLLSSVNVSASRALSSQSINVSSDTNYPTLSVYTESSWGVEIRGDFIYAYNPGGTAGNAQIALRINSNPNTTSRSGSVTVHDCKGATTFYITQSGAPKPVTPSITLSQQDILIENDLWGSLYVTSNVSWTASANVNWIHLNKTSGSAGQTFFSFDCDKYTGDRFRGGRINFYNNGKIYATLNVMQGQEYVLVPGVEIGHTKWGKYESSYMSKYPVLKAYNHTVYIDYDQLCYAASDQLIRFTHVTDTHIARAKNKYTSVKGNYDKCHDRDNVHDFHCCLINWGNSNRGRWYGEAPTVEIKTTFYNNITRKEEDVTYVIRFTNINLASITGTPYEQWCGVAFNVMYPNPALWWNNKPAASGISTAQCPKCVASFYGQDAQSLLKSHMAQCHGDNPSDFYKEETTFDIGGFMEYLEWFNSLNIT